jgi:hypothetical protein
MNGSFTIPPEKVITIPSGSTRDTFAFLYSLPVIVLKSSARTTDAKQMIKMKTFKNAGIMGRLLAASSGRGKTRKTAFREFPISSPGEFPMQHSSEDSFSGFSN